MNSVKNMEMIHEAFQELKLMEAIICPNILPSNNNAKLYLNLKRLRNLGYALLFEDGRPIFCDINRINYMYDCNFYLSNVIPVHSLSTYSMLKIKNCNFSI